MMKDDSRQHKAEPAPTRRTTSELHRNCTRQPLPLMFSYSSSKKKKSSKRFRGSQIIAKVEDNIWLDAKETDIVIPCVAATLIGFAILLIS